MPTSPQLAMIEEEIQRRFLPSNPITEAIANRLSRTLFQQRRCESLLEFARSIPEGKLAALPLSKQTSFQQTTRKLVEKIKDLKRSSREYSAALSAQTKSPSNPAQITAE
ncbi:MAG: hypothetical protein ABIQ44_04765 [Chloroflexia bacterium]